MPIDAAWITTAGEFPGLKHRFLGLVIGVVVRDANAFDSYKGADAMAAACEQMRFQALTRMATRAAQLRANAIVAVKYETTIIAVSGIAFDKGRTEVCAYGTATWVEQ
jgi:uncharacterized protein YbjQ (UPF0145 family)